MQRKEVLEKAKILLDELKGIDDYNLFFEKLENFNFKIDNLRFDYNKEKEAYPILNSLYSEDKIEEIYNYISKNDFINIDEIIKKNNKTLDLTAAFSKENIISKLTDEDLKEKINEKILNVKTGLIEELNNKFDINTKFTDIENENLKIEINEEILKDVKLKCYAHAPYDDWTYYLDIYEEINGNKKLVYSNANNSEIAEIKLFSLDDIKNLVEKEKKTFVRSENLTLVIDDKIIQNESKIENKEKMNLMDRVSGWLKKSSDKEMER